MQVNSQMRYQLEPDLSADEFVAVLRQSTLAERRPVDQPDRIQGMLDQADLILAARLDGHLVGVSRALTDFQFCTYLSDLAVVLDHQRTGIGRQLIQRTHRAAGLHTTLILLAAPRAASYYPHIGMECHESCWIIKPTRDTMDDQAGSDTP
jgi:GNAT superfamily N-acetyltransferase